MFGILNILRVMLMCLKKDGKTHIRIDYKMSGLGSNSCGPELDKEYRLDEKKIKFNFTIKPAVL